MRRSSRVRVAALAAAFALVLSVVGGAVTAPAPAAAAPGDCVENPFGDRPLYLRGGFSSWNALPEYELVYSCNRFEAVVDLDGTSSFKIADADWSADADFGGGELTPGEPTTLRLQGPNLTFAFAGTQRVVLDVSASVTQPALTITSCPAPPLGDALLALSGTMNDGEPGPGDYFVRSCDAYFLNVDLEGTHEFVLTDPAGGGATTFGAPDAEHAQAQQDVPFPLVAQGDAATVEPVRFDFAGRHTLRLDVAEDGSAPTLTITEETFVNPGAEVPVTDPVARQVRFDSRSEADRAPYGAQPAGTTVDFALTAPAGVDSATLVAETRLLEGNQEVLEYLDPVRVPLTREPGADVDRWTASHTFDAVSVYGYYFEVVVGGETYVYQNNDATIYWTLERGSGGVGEIAFAPEDRADVQRYRHTSYSPDFTVPDWASDAVYYYVFPERFRNGDPGNDPDPAEDTYLDAPVEVHENWLERPFVPGDADGSTTDDDQYNNDFFGGDLPGIIEKLDYLDELGVNTLYINPIFEAASNHKYDTADYLHVDDGFGTDEDVSRLTAEAEARGMRVVLDTSLNHTGSDSAYFDRYSNFPEDGAFEGGTINPDSPYADFYTFHPEETEPDRQYDGWTGVTTLPELTESESWKDFAFRGPDSVMGTWQARGIDGWRMDVAPWVSDPFWREWRTEVKANDPEALTIAETWFDSSKYFLGDTFDTTMNYIFRNAVLDYADGRNAAQAYENIELMREAYPPQAFYALMNLLSTHDAARALHQFGYTDDTVPPEQEAEAKQRLRLAVLFQMTFPGAPSVYYGDEVGVTGGEDPFNRATYPWEDEGGTPDTAVLAEFQELIALRNEHDVLRNGSIGAPLHTDEHVVVLLREQDGVQAVTAYNNDTTAHEVTVDLPAGSAGQFTDALTGAVAAPVDGRLTLTVPALDGNVLISDAAPEPVPTIGELKAALREAQRAREVTGPVSVLLSTHLFLAETLHAHGKDAAAVRQLERFVDRLEDPPGRHSRVTPEAADRLGGMATALAASWR
jgi:glycosidase